MDKVRVGISGYGIVGKRRHEYLKRHPTATVVGVCDQLFPTDQTQVDGIRCYSNYRELLADQDIDALFVCLTNDVAADATIAGLQNSLHVICEKPPGRDVADVIRVMDVEKGSPGHKLMYGFNHRYHHSVRKALDLVGSGSFGKIINIRGLYGKSKLVTFDQPDWRAKRKVAGGGILLDQGIHMVDLIRLFAGEFVEVHGFVSNNFWNYDVEDNAYALMRTKDGMNLPQFNGHPEKGYHGP
jgi:predicted dehydrogenase